MTEGFYQIPDLPPGSYRLTASLSTFAPGEWIGNRARTRPDADAESHPAILDVRRRGRRHVAKTYGDSPGNSDVDHGADQRYDRTAEGRELPGPRTAGAGPERGPPRPVRPASRCAVSIPVVLRRPSGSTSVTCRSDRAAVSPTAPSWPVTSTPSTWQGSRCCVARKAPCTGRAHLAAS